MNLLSLAERLAALDSAPIRLEADRCLHARYKSATCDACVRVCPTQAIRLNGSITLNTEACVACGACLPACPTGAFDGQDGVADVLKCVGGLGPGCVIELACAQHPAPGKGATEAGAVVRTAGCLAALGPSAYLSIVALAVQRVYVRLDACAGCPIGQAKAPIAAAIAQTHQWLELYGLTDRIIALNVVNNRKDRRVQEAKSATVSRRSLFRMFAAEAPRQIGQVIIGDIHNQKPGD